MKSQQRSRLFSRFVSADNKAIMAYTVGTHIDLRYLNKRSASSSQKKRLSSARHIYKVGTRILFPYVPTGFETAFQIPVAIA